MNNITILYKPLVHMQINKGNRKARNIEDMKKIEGVVTMVPKCEKDFKRIVFLYPILVN